MRHRLFHAVVIVGAALPGCGSDDASIADAAVDSAKADTATAPDTATNDSATTDSALVDSATAPDTSEDAPCEGGCGDKCLPCIK